MQVSFTLPSKKAAKIEHHQKILIDFENCFIFTYCINLNFVLVWSEIVQIPTSFVGHKIHIDIGIDIKFDIDFLIAYSGPSLVARLRLL